MYSHHGLPLRAIQNHQQNLSWFVDGGPDINFADLAKAKENRGSAELKVRTLPLFVDLRGLNQNTWRRVQKVVPAWEKARGEVGQFALEAPKLESPMVTEPRRRSRTPLTPNEVDSIRTLRGAGVSVSQLAKQFGVHRMTIWEKTREM